MTTPRHHEDETSPGFRLVLRQLDRVENTLSGLSEKFDALGDKFVPRQELNGWKDSCDQRHLDAANRLTALEAGRQADRQHSDDAVEKAEARRLADRNTMRVTALMFAGLLLTLLTLVIAHWK